MKLHSLIWLAGILPCLAHATGIDVASCRQKGELQESCYPKSDAEWRAKCGANTPECKETWKILSMARLQVRDDYGRLCSHLDQAARSSASCGDRENCLGDAAANTRTALDDTTKLESDLEKLRKATREARFDNLRRAREEMAKPLQQVRAEPKCWGDWGYTMRLWGMIVGDAAWAGKVGPGSVTPIPPTDHKVSGEPAAPPAPEEEHTPAATTASSPEKETYSSKRPSYGEPTPPDPESHAPGASKPPRDAKDAETTGYNQAAADKPVSESLFPQMRAPVAENLRASTGASTAMKELGRKQDEASRDKAELARQLAQLESRRNNLASAPSGPGESPASSFPAQASADTPNMPAVAPREARGGGDFAFAPAAAQEAPVGAKGTASRPDFASPARAVASGGGNGYVPSGGSENSQSRITRSGDDPLPKNAAKAAHATATAKDTQAGSRKSSALAEALRRELDAKAAAKAAMEKADELLNKPGTAAEGAIAAVIRDDGHSVSLAGGLHTGHDLTGLTPAPQGDSTDPEQAALLPANSPGLFERVHAAHRRFERSSRTRTAEL